MELKNLIAPDHRASGLSCRNCANLVCEYDLDAGGTGVWVCDKFPVRVNSKPFPFEHDMPCFELSFWFTVFAQNLSENDDSGCEAAMESFTRSMALLDRHGVISNHYPASGMDAQ